jgi:hypothetical protein
MNLNQINLIDAFTYYLLVAFAIGTILRLRNYYAIVRLIWSFPSRYPRLLDLLKKYRTIFLQGPTLLPIGCTAALTVANMLASQLLWSHASVTPADLSRHGAACVFIVPTGVAMLVLDFRAVFLFGKFDKEALEENLDKAESWLESWQAPALRILTFGLVNPRRIVNDQVREAILKANVIVNGQIWRWALQIGMRLAFGLALWETWMVALRGASTGPS